MALGLLGISSTRASRDVRLFYQLTLVSASVATLITLVLSFSLFDGLLRAAPLLPAFYFGFLLLVGLTTWRTLPSPFLAISLITSFLRYVAFPLLVTFEGEYVGRSWVEPAQESYDLSVVLMCFELVAIGFTILFLEARYQRIRRASQSITSRSLPVWYTLCVSCVAMIAVLAFPQSIFLLSFLSYGFDLDELALPATASLAAMLVMAAKVLVSTKIIHEMARAKRWLAVSRYAVLLVGIVNIFVYFGSNRMAIVLTAVATGWILYMSYGKRARTPLMILGLSGLLAFSVVTERREYVQTSGSHLAKAADQIQAYTGGVYNVAIGIEVPNYYPEASSWSGLVFDFLRPTVGFNLITQNWNQNYSNQYFNWRMFTHVERRSQIMPMIAQGYLYFGLLFAPVLSVFFAWVGYKLQGWIWKTEYIEVKYCLFLVSLRLGFFWGQNSMNIMNFLSLNLFIPLLLLASYFVMKSGLSRNQRSATASRLSLAKWKF